MNTTADFKRTFCLPLALLLGMAVLPISPSYSADAAATPAASPATTSSDIAGVWTLTMDGNNGTKMERELTITKSGDAYSGKLGRPRRLSATGQPIANANNGNNTANPNRTPRETDVQDVTFKDGELSFTTSNARNNGETRKRTYRGRLQGDVIEGTVEGGQNSRKWRATRAAADSGFGGTWDVTIHTQDRDYKGVLTLNKTGDDTSGTYEAVMEGRDNAKATLKDVSVKDNTLKYGVDLPIEVNGQSTLHADFTGTKDGDTIKGQNTTSFGTADFTAVRRKAAATAAGDLTGTWKLTVTTPNGTFNPTLTLKKDGDAYSGEMAFTDRSVPLKSVTVTGNSFKAIREMTRNGQTTTLEMTGTLEGDTLKGQWTSPRGTMTYTAERQKTPAAP